ncbi:MAG: hypothetical protein ACI9MC_003182 [Kiritimatiellia bacterium]
MQQEIFMSLPLIAELTTDDGRTFRALPVSTTPSGIWVAVPHALAAGLQADCDLSVQIICTGQRPWHSPCRVTQTIKARDALELQLVWANAGRVRLAMPGAIREALNAAAHRYGAQPHVRWDHADNYVLDMSEDGCTIAVASHSEVPSGSIVQGDLVLPDRCGAQPFRARVGRVHIAGNATQISMSFVGAPRVRGRMADRISAWLQTQRRRDIRQTG